MSESLARLPIERAEDVYVLRQSARTAAAAIGCDEADQVRIATALSELGRETLAHNGHAEANFTLDEGVLQIEILRFPRAATEAGATTGLTAARRLVDDVTIEDATAATVTVRLRRVPPQSGSSRAKVRTPAQVRAMLTRTVAPTALDEIRLENRDLIATLESLRENQDELVRLNAELEETNRGVMAMYTQLADELEETNRGVVALYAELDDRTVQLNAASEAKTRFLANVSHELRGPVNSILGLNRLLVAPDGDALTAEQRKQLDLMGRSSTELLRLVNDLLDLAKAESGRLEPDITSVDLAEIFSELRGSLRPLVKPGVKLIVEDPATAPVETDRMLIGQVLRNLLTNALKFTTGGSVTLRARQLDPHHLDIDVTDTGIGIAPEHQPRIFEEFFQVRGTLQTQHKGTGLGLPYARRVTETLGGRITVESELGAGSTFCIHLSNVWQPLLRAHVSPGRPSGEAVLLSSVLIVDDDEGFRTTLRGMLQGLAGQVLEASGGMEGLALMRSARPSLAFVDLRMPDIEGADVLAAMKTDPNLREIPVVIVTSSDFTAAVQNTLSGATALLAKSTITRESVRLVVASAAAV